MGGNVQREEDGELLRRLDADASVAERLRVFKEIGFKPARLRAAIGISPETWRLWSNGGPVRPSNRVVVDNLSRAISVLLRAAGRGHVVDWLTTPLKTDAGVVAPLDLLREHPESVLAAVDAEAARKHEDAKRFLAQALDDRRLAGDAPGDVGTSEWSSTQLKRLLLGHLQEITAKHTPARDVAVPFDDHYRNYEAYRRFSVRVRERLDAAGDAPVEMAISNLLARVTAEEEELRQHFGQVGAELLADPSCKAVLTYSMSMRVLQALLGVDPARQADCTIYVAEGRVKSVPHRGELPAFADAAEILRFLAATRYDRRIVPDALAASLVVLGRVDLVLLGAQKVFVDAEGAVTHFVATIGTDAILRAARDRGVKVCVLAEDDKVIKVTEAEPAADARERIVPIALPPTAGGTPSGHAHLLMMSAELCNVTRGDPDAVGDPSIVRHRAREPQALVH